MKADAATVTPRLSGTPLGLARAQDKGRWEAAGQTGLNKSR